MNRAGVASRYVERLVAGASLAQLGGRNVCAPGTYSAQRTQCARTERRGGSITVALTANAPSSRARLPRPSSASGGIDAAMNGIVAGGSHHICTGIGHVCAGTSRGCGGTGQPQGRHGQPLGTGTDQRSKPATLAGGVPQPEHTRSRERREGDAPPRVRRHEPPGTTRGMPHTSAHVACSMHSRSDTSRAAYNATPRRR